MNHILKFDLLLKLSLKERSSLKNKRREIVKLIFGAQKLCKLEENWNWNKNYETFNAIEKFIL